MAWTFHVRALPLYFPVVPWADAATPARVSERQDRQGDCAAHNVHARGKGERGKGEGEVRLEGGERNSEPVEKSSCLIIPYYIW
jgi:hypothetical protein